jgi:hypothetical protein
MSLIDLLLAERTIGVINPSGSATATEMSASAADALGRLIKLYVDVRHGYQRHGAGLNQHIVNRNLDAGYFAVDFLTQC